MSHHHTKNTVEASLWCNRCNKETPWRIADGRQQFCLTCYSKPTEAKAAPGSQQMDLFKGGAR